MDFTLIIKNVLWRLYKNRITFTYNPQSATCNLQPAIRNPQSVTRNPQPAIRNKYQPPGFAANQMN